MSFHLSLVSVGGAAETLRGSDVEAYVGGRGSVELCLNLII
jgi:hypothetical protein